MHMMFENRLYHGFFPVTKTRSVGVTKNGEDTPEHCCRSELMDRENAPN